MASASSLSRNDLSVLSAIFDPEGSPSEMSYHFQSTGSGDYLIDEDGLRHELEAIASLNSERPSESKIRATIITLDDLVERYPGYASAFNNRAQARRMLQQCGHIQTSQEHIQLILSDLDQAISLVPGNNASASHAKVLAAAYTHRGQILYEASKSQTASAMLPTIDGSPVPDSEMLQEMASRDFALGGRWGNKVARQMAVQTNPYAKLCGQMVKQALQKEMQDFRA